MHKPTISVLYTYYETAIKVKTCCPIDVQYREDGVMDRQVINVNDTYYDRGCWNAMETPLRGLAVDIVMSHLYSCDTHCFHIC